MVFFISSLSLSLILPIACSWKNTETIEKNFSDQILKDEIFFNNDIKKQNLVNLEYFIAEDKTNTAALAKMGIKIPNITHQKIRREYKIKNIDWDTSKLQVETIIFANNESKKLI